MTTRDTLTKFSKMGAHVLVVQIVNRDCHASMRELSVVRHVRSKLRRGAWGKMDHEHRRYLVWSAIVTHRANRDLYGFVMGGMHGRTGG